MEQTAFEDGDIVQVLKDGSRGIVVGQSPRCVNVLFESYIAAPVLKSQVKKLDKHYDLKNLWDWIYGR